MIVGVRRLRHQGRALTPEQRRQVPLLFGDLRVGEQRVPQLGGRTCLVAVLRASDGHARRLPPLFDARLLWMSASAFMLGGIEVKEELAWAQSWLCLAGQTGGLPPTRQDPEVALATIPEVLEPLEGSGILRTVGEPLTNVLPTFGATGAVAAGGPVPMNSLRAFWPSRRPTGLAVVHGPKLMRGYPSTAA